MTNIWHHFSRTFRLAVVEGTDFAAAGIGYFLSGPLFNAVGYTGVFGISIFVGALPCIWIIFFLKESVTKKKDEEKEQTEDNENSTQLQSICLKLLRFVKTSFLYLIDSLRTLVKPRQGYRRKDLHKRWDHMGMKVIIQFNPIWRGVEIIYDNLKVSLNTELF